MTRLFKFLELYFIWVFSMGRGSGFGKAILFGEHFVVHGVPGIVSAIDLTVDVEVKRIGEGIHVRDERKGARGYAEKKRTQQKESIERMLKAMGIDLEEASLSKAAYERIVHKMDDYQFSKVPVPFANVMAFGTYQQKRLVIQKALRFFRPEFADIFFQGLNDDNNLSGKTGEGYCRVFE